MMSSRASTVLALACIVSAFTGCLVLIWQGAHSGSLGSGCTPRGTCQRDLVCVRNWGYQEGPLYYCELPEEVSRSMGPPPPRE